MGSTFIIDDLVSLNLHTFAAADEFWGISDCIKNEEKQGKVARAVAKCEKNVRVEGGLWCRGAVEGISGISQRRRHVVKRKSF